MRKHQKHTMVLKIILVFMTFILILPALSEAGDVKLEAIYETVLDNNAKLQPVNDIDSKVTDINSMMPLLESAANLSNVAIPNINDNITTSLETIMDNNAKLQPVNDIHSKVTDINSKMPLLESAANLSNVAIPNIYDIVLAIDAKLNSINCEGPPAPVEKTGQAESYATGDDGALQRGVAWPDPRFTDNGDGTLTDNLTGLIWLKNANCFGAKAWSDALIDCNGLANGICNLTDGSIPGDWRMPNIREMLSLLDYGNINPALPSGHPFVDMQIGFYWTSTSNMIAEFLFWNINIYEGYSSYNMEDYPHFVMAVRGGN